MLMTQRRILLAGAAAFVALPALHVRVRAQARARPTPAQTEGPFYPVELPSDNDADLLRIGAGAPYARGEPAWVHGTVSDVSGAPLKGAVVEIWQCDPDGRYHHPGDRGRADPAFQGFGRVQVGADGRYRFRTLRPAPYSGRTPHIHFKVRLGSRELLTTQMYVEGEPRNERDGLWRSLRDPADRTALTRPFDTVADGLQAEFPIVISA
jgi:protocatechuate 3,4-dioxygenase beta subunit